MNGRFKKGHVPHNKGKKLSPSKIEKMKQAYKKRAPRLDRGGTGRNTTKYREWKRLVFERDMNKCVKCESNYQLDAHHIVAWIDNENLRFEVTNGQTLCRSCHMSHEFEERKKKGISTEFKKGIIPWNKGLKGYRSGKREPRSEETKRKISESKKGKRNSISTEFKKGIIPHNKKVKNGTASN